MTLDQDARSHPLRQLQGRAWPGIAFLLLLTLLQFGDVLFSTGHPVLSGPNTDLVMADGPWGAFIARTLGAGVFPLWNPHVFSGTPFFTTGEQPLLYPATWLYCLLPLDKALDVLIAFHIFWLGLGMYLWALRRKLSPPSAVVAAAIVMFGGPTFYHIYAGHVTNLMAMAWVPFLFLAVDTVMDGDYLAGALIGSLSFALEFFTCEPQYTFYGLFTLAIYAGLRLVRSEKRIKKVAVLGVASALGIGVTAFQLMAVLPQLGESIRSEGVSRAFATMLSLPPENAATLLAPGLFGDCINLAYWGRYYLWEASLFFGVAGLCLAIHGVVARRNLIYAAMAVSLILLALGSHTPIYPLLYDHFPGFDRFRGPAKFSFDAMLFLALLAAEGFEALREGGKPRAIATIAFVLALLTGASGLYLVTTLGSGLWGNLATWIVATGASLASALPSNPDLLNATADFASVQLLIACGSLVVVGVLFLASKQAWARHALFVVLMLELFVFAHHIRATIDVSQFTEPKIAGFLQDHTGDDYRVFDAPEQNEGMVTGADDAWGYDSFILKRYAEFMAYSKGLSLDDITNLTWPAITHYSPLWRLIRLGYAAPNPSTAVTNLNIVTYPAGLPHLLLVNRCEVVHGRDAILPALANQGFDPYNDVILEQPPNPAPVDAGDPGTATLVSENPNRLLIDVDARHPCILLITDSYSRNWKAIARPGSAQRSYQLLPADYTLRAVPLTAGVHHISVEFDPPGLRAGAAISIASLAVYLAFLARYWRRRRVGQR